MQDSQIRLQTLHAGDISRWVPELSRLRIAVFREYPYLYEGSEQEEAEYLHHFVAAQDNILILAQDAGRVVGAATGMPLMQADPLFRAPWLRAGHQAEGIFYFAESVLLPQYRGRGIGKAFLQEREAFARRLGQFTHVSFCAVVREEGEVAAPASYRSPEYLWRKCGFEPRTDIEALLAWREIGASLETEKRMRFWWKSLGSYVT